MLKLTKSEPNGNSGIELDGTFQRMSAERVARFAACLERLYGAPTRAVTMLARLLGDNTITTLVWDNLGREALDACGAV